MGSIVPSSPFASLTDARLVPNQALPGVGLPLGSYKHTGLWYDFAMAADGGPNAFTFTGVPTDAVALEVWANGSAADDYVFWSGVGGLLSNAGALATNVAANLLARRHSAAGQPMLLPFSAKGVLPSTWRFAGSKAATRLNARCVADSSAIPYLSATATEWNLTGNNTSQQLPFNSAPIFPVGTVAVQMQLVGPGPARLIWDGTQPPSATFGALLTPGSYLLDIAKHGIALSALRIFLPTGTNLVGNALIASA